MLFKLEAVARDLYIHERHPFDLHVDGQHGHKVRVVVRALESQEQTKGRATDVRCISNLAREPSPDVVEFFRRIDRDDVFDPDKHPYVAFAYVNPEGMKIRLPEPDLLPETFQSFLRQVRKELSEPAARTIRVMRWRIDRPGPPRALLGEDYFWSFDGVAWSPLPSSYSAELTAIGKLTLPRSLADDITALVASGKDEPIYHVLFREAWSQRSSNPGSSLVMGITALEVGVKSLIATIIPQAGWLAMNAPTPPVADILKNYVPTLNARNTFGGKVKPPPRKVRNLIDNGVRLRNKLAHRGESAPPPKELRQLLIAILDCLWLFDYYSGHAWAVANITEETLSELRNE